jgi:protein-disulfide isomerase
MSTFWTRLAPLFAATLLACGGSAEPAPQPPVVDAAVPAVPASAGVVLALAADTSPNPGPIPVSQNDPQRGSETAPVTLVMFGDFECPYSAKAARTLAALEERYGHDRLRIVFKHDPLPFRKTSPRMHLDAESAFRAGGNDAFWAYFHHVYIEADRADGFDLISERAMSAALRQRPELGQKLSGATYDAATAKVDADIALGKELGVGGTPAFFINGVNLVGAQDRARFEAVIDAELEAARAKLVDGRAPAGWYAARTAENIKNAPPKPDKKRAETPPDTSVWKVPVGKSPVRGPADALVTIVAFGDFQCPYTAKAQATLAELMKRYPSDVRVVFKHRPLPFHKNAIPAHQLAQEVFAKKGNDAFWKASDLLFESAANLDEAALARVAKEAGLDPQSALAAVKAKKHARTIADDELLADDVEASGTPTFFINGRRVVGARAVEDFVAVIDERLADARAVEQRGVARSKVYDEVMKTATAGDAPGKRTPPAIPATAPSRGPKNAPVTIQFYGDLQCPFCKKAFDLLPELEKEFPGKLRIVWRDLPLPMHKQAEPAAIALREVQRLKGNDAFWKMVASLYENQKDLGAEAIEKAAAAVGVPADKLRAADESSASGKLVQTEADAAKKAEVKATPTFFVNGYFITGASETKLRSAIRRALAEKSKP